MKENMLQILLYLFEKQINSRTQASPGREIIIKQLCNAGFDLPEIHHALNWLEELKKSAASFHESPAMSAQSFRVLAAEEHHKINKECWEYMLFLERAGILAPETREIVIDRLLDFPRSQIDLPQVKWVVLMVLFNNADHAHELHEMQVLILEEKLDHTLQ